MSGLYDVNEECTMAGHEIQADPRQKNEDGQRLRALWSKLLGKLMTACLVKASLF